MSSFSSSSSSSSSITSPHPTANHLPESPAGKWYPYKNATDFDANLAMILVLLLCALLLALAINALIRCFLRLSRRHDRSSHLPETSTGKLKSPGPTVLPSMIYSRGLKLAGAGAECAICLSEFVNGEGIRVLPRCQHGFHVKCIQHWLAAHSSCPTCRASCLSNSLEKNPGSETMVVAGENSPETVSSRV